MSEEFDCSDSDSGTCSIIIVHKIPWNSESEFLLQFTVNTHLFFSGLNDWMQELNKKVQEKDKLEKLLHREND